MASFSTSKEAQGTTPAKNRIPSYRTGQTVLQHRTYQCPTAPDSCPTKCPTAPDIQTVQPVLHDRTYLELTTPNQTPLCCLGISISVLFLSLVLRPAITTLP